MNDLVLQKYLIAKDWLHRLIERSFQWRLAVLAQGLWSAASFLVTMYLVRSLAVHDFGMFAVGVSTRYFFLMILSALAISPMLVISSRRVVNNQKDPLLAAIVFSFEIIFFISVLISIFVGRLNGWPAVEFVIFIFGGLAVELQRRINFIHQRISQDFVGGLVSIAGTIGSLFLLQKYGFFTLANIFLVLGLVNFLWACQSGWGYWLRPSVPSEIADLNEVWKIGRWGLGTNLAGYAYTQVSTFLTLGLIGTAGVAVLELGRQFILPIQVLLVGAANLWQTKLARSAAKNSPAYFVREVWRVSWIQTLVGAGLLLVILFFLPFLIPWLVPGKEQAYAASLPVAWILSGAMICQLLWAYHSFGVVALGKPEYGFFTKSVTFLFLLPIGYLMTKEWGLIGASWSRFLGEFLVFALSVVMLRRAASDRKNDPELMVDGLKQRPSIAD